jgi:protein ImuA
MIPAKPQSAPVSRQQLAPLSESERLRLLRKEIAGIEAANHGVAMLASGETPRARIPLGHAGLDRMLAGGLQPGALHEIVAARPGDHPAAASFALALATRLKAARNRGSIVWIGEDFAALEQGALYGPGLALHGIDPDCLLLVHAASAKEALWAMEEALRCRAPAAVIGEIFTAKAYDLIASRRLVLAAQKNATPGLLFLAGLAGADAFSSGADTRFEVRAQPSAHLASAACRLPLPGSAAWSIRIAKARAGPTGFGIDRDKFHPVFWTEVCFRDALSLPLAALPGDGPDHPAGEFGEARRWALGA